MIGDRITGDPEICRGFLGLYLPDMIEPFTDSILTKNGICNRYLNACHNPTYRVLDADDFEGNHQPNHDLIDLYSNKTNQSIIRSIHITDLHFDKNYDRNHNAKCSLPLCCRANSDHSSPFVKPEKYGSMKCDVPFETVEYMMDFINKS